MKKQGLWKWFLILFLLLLVTGCSGSSDSDNVVVGAESIYSPGASVSAVSYDDAYGIEVFVLDGDGSFIPVYDGDYVEPGVKTFGVQAEGDPSNIDRVFFSDGGLYQIEAFKQGDLYAGEFDVGEENLYQNILVQIIHNNSLASKEKVVLRTFRHNYDNQYVKNGVGLLVAREILEAQRDALAESLDEIVRDVFSQISTQGAGLFEELGYGDNDPDTIDIEVSSLEATNTDEYPRAVIHVSLVVKDLYISALSLYGQNLVSTRNNDLAIDMFLAVDDEGEDGSIRFSLDFLDSVQMSFEKDFFLKSIVEEMLALELNRIELPPIAYDLSGFEDSLHADFDGNFFVNGSAVDLNVLFDGLNIDLNKYLFADTYGIPGDTDSDALSLGLGLCLADYEDIVWRQYESQPASSDEVNMEDVFEELFEAMVNDAFEEIRQEYNGLVTELSYGDDDPDTRDFMVNSFVLEDTAVENIKNVRINYTIKNVDFRAVSLFGFSLIYTSDNDLTIDSCINLKHIIADAGAQLVLDIQDVSDVNFCKFFVGRSVIEGMIRNDLEGMEEASFNIEEILSDISLDLDFTEGLYSGCEVPLFPDVIPYLNTPSWELVLPESYNVASAVSQCNINWIIEAALNQDIQWDVNELIVALLEEDFAGFTPDRSEDEETIMYLSVPPVIDARTSRIRVLINDVILQYRVGGEPQWEASVDLDMIVEPRVEDNKIDFYLTQIPENTHFHVMRDNPGNLGIFDHSTLVNDILDGLPEMLGGSASDPIFSVDLDAFKPAVVFKDIACPLSVTCRGGYLYIDMAVDSLDLSGVVD